MNLQSFSGAPPLMIDKSSSFRYNGEDKAPKGARGLSLRRGRPGE